MNDFPDSIPREKQTDADRVFPGDGIAPLTQILTDLKNLGGTKVLSLELFNPLYYKEDPLWIAKTGLEKMRSLAKEV
jgi:sugar phosphate isomerase/epimerase